MRIVVVFSMGRYAAPEAHEALLSRRQDALRAAVISIFKTLPPAGDEITAVRLAGRPAPARRSPL